MGSLEFHGLANTERCLNFAPGHPPYAVLPRHSTSLPATFPASPSQRREQLLCSRLLPKHIHDTGAASLMARPPSQQCAECSNGRLTSQYWLASGMAWNRHALGSHIRHICAYFGVQVGPSSQQNPPKPGSMRLITTGLRTSSTPADPPPPLLVSLIMFHNLWMLSALRQLELCLARRTPKQHDNGTGVCYWQAPSAYIQRDCTSCPRMWLACF